MQRWTRESIPDLTGKTAVITGANEGIGFESAYSCTDPHHKNTSIGYETALELARHNCKIIMACRDRTRASKSKADILTEIPNAKIEIVPLDLTDFASIRKFAIDIKIIFGVTSISYLVNNAGTNARPHSLTRDGHEAIFQTNYLGHFLLTKELFPMLITDGNARIVTVTSYYHHFGKIDLDNLDCDLDYNYFTAYANSKLEEIMFSFELQRRITAANLPLLSTAVQPGSTKSTMLYRYPNQDARHWFIKQGERIAGQSPRDGALPSLYACTAPDVEGGKLYGPDSWFEISGNPVAVKPAEAANNIDLARQLWEKSEALIGEEFEMISKPPRGLSRLLL